MTAAKKHKIRKIIKSDYKIYLKKAKEFYQTMYQAEKAENWNAVGLNGVHTVMGILKNYLFSIIIVVFQGYMPEMGINL